MSFQELRKRNRELGVIRENVAEIGRLLGIEVFSRDTCATPSHVVQDTFTIVHKLKKDAL